MLAPELTLTLDYQALYYLLIDRRFEMQNFVFLLLEVMNKHLHVSKKFTDPKSPWIFIEFISHPLEVCVTQASKLLVTSYSPCPI